MRRAVLLFALSPLLAAACGSFGVTDPAGEAGDADVRADGAGDVIAVDGAVIDGAASDAGHRVPPECPLPSCTSGLPGEDCRDDECAPDDNDFDSQGAAARTDAGQCTVLGGTGSFSRTRIRHDTPSRFAEVAFDLVEVETAAVSRIASLGVSGSEAPRVDLTLTGGYLFLCTADGSDESCVLAGTPPIGKRLHLYGVIGIAANVAQSFGVAVGCDELARVAVPAAFGAGTQVLATVGCLDAPCGLVTDNLVVATRP